MGHTQERRGPVKTVRASLGHEVPDDTTSRPLGRYIGGLNIDLFKREAIDVERSPVLVEVHSVDKVFPFIAAIRRDTGLTEHRASAYVVFGNRDARRESYD